MKSIAKIFKIRGRRFSLTGIFSSSSVLASIAKLIVGICFFLFIFVLTLSSSSLFNLWLRPTARIEDFLSIQVRHLEPVRVRTFWVKFNGRHKLNAFSFETESNMKMEKDRALRSSEPLRGRERCPEKVMLSVQGMINQSKIMNDSPVLSESPEVFESEPGKKGRLLLALNLKKNDLAFETIEILRQNQEKEKRGEAEGKEEIIRPEFKNIKERISIYAFLAWLWLIIGVLLYVLNEQIKEAARRRRLGL